MDGPTGVFIAGAPRSGTTLCAQILNANSRLTIFDEVNILELCALYDALRANSSANVARAMTRLNAGVKRLIEAKLEARLIAEFVNGCSSSYEFVRALLPRSESIDIWGDKYPSYTNELQQIKSRLPSSAIVFVVRHPAALVSSFLRYRGERQRSIDDFWITDSAGEGIARLENIATQFAANRTLFYALRYEQLVDDPRSAVSALCDALGIEFEEQMLNYEPGPLPGSSAARQFQRKGEFLPWKCANCKKVDPSFATRWQQEAVVTRLVDSEIERIDRLAEIFGYSKAALAPA